MRDDEREDEDGEEGEREDEHVEETVVPPSHAVPHPGTVVVKTLCMNRERQTEGEKECLFYFILFHTMFKKTSRLLQCTEGANPELWETRGNGKCPSGSWHNNIQIFHIVETGYLYKLANRSYMAAEV